MISSPTVIILAGPTAAGKTALAIQLAERLGAAIISADSRQCYHEMKIGVARPSEEELQRVPHYFIADHALHEPIHAAFFEQMALQTCRQLHEKNPVVVMTGGTGLYIKAFMEGLDAMPAIPEDIRNQLQHEYETKGLDWLQTEVRKSDPDFWEQAEQQNPRRLQRALEVIRTTGQSILHYRKAARVQRPFEMIPFYLQLPAPLLRDRIDQRVDAMITAGWVEEVRSLIPYRALPALQTVGYRELMQYIDGAYSLEEAIRKIKINTWQYARRQMTWIKKQSGFTPLAADQDPWKTLLQMLGEETK
ncbi:MAG: tRNA (adenosine(37)-N6)-dimethylallyltransferase MiaA [Bacteroidota bacterium]